MSQTFLFLGITVFFTVLSHLCLKKGVLGLGDLNFSFDNFISLFSRILQNYWLVSGIFLIGISFIFWLFVISRIKLNLAYPIATGLNVALIVIFSWIFLKEHLLPIQILGIVVIIFGIFLILKS
ncbi:MAG: SMR family transporter [Nanoarchaeota archaeon]|nr:SMR family transporter [Nanoarchaeota archaeon]